MSTRRLILTRTAAMIGAASTGLMLPVTSRAQSGKVRVGFMLPYTGTFSQLGAAIENGFRLAIDEQGGLTVDILGRDVLQLQNIDDQVFHFQFKHGADFLS